MTLFKPKKIFGNFPRKVLLRLRILTTFVFEELFEVMQKNASKRWIFVT